MKKFIACMLVSGLLFAGTAMATEPTTEQRLDTVEDVMKNHNEVIQEHRKIIIALIREIQKLRAELESITKL